MGTVDSSFDKVITHLLERVAEMQAPQNVKENGSQAVDARGGTTEKEAAGEWRRRRTWMEGK
jgi:hypothetical protein